jgi:hypothetical protein
MGVDEGVLNASVAEDSHDVEDVFGFLVFHGGFEVSKRMKGELASLKKKL